MAPDELACFVTLLLHLLQLLIEPVNGWPGWLLLQLCLLGLLLPLLTRQISLQQQNTMPAQTRGFRQQHVNLQHSGLQLMSGVHAGFISATESKGSQGWCWHAALARSGLSTMQVWTAVPGGIHAVPAAPDAAAPADP